MNHVILLTHDQLHLLIWALDQIDGAFPEKRDEAEYNEEEWTTLTSNIEECLDLSNRLAEDLHQQLDLPMAILEKEQSEFFKHHYRSNWHNQGVMVREIDVIRKLEGW